MTTKTIRVRLPATEVQRRLKNLPKILSGTAPDPDGLRQYFFAIVARYLFNKIHAAYRIKAMGGTDELGNTWRALRPATIRRRLAPKFVARFPKSAELQILRITDTIFNSLQPGRISGTQYTPRPNQLFELDRNELRIGTEVEYAPFVNKKRRLWPARMRPWINEAIDIATSKTIERMAENMAKER
jgi:hypothetical protein